MAPLSPSPPPPSARPADDWRRPRQSEAEQRQMRESCAPAALAAAAFRDENDINLFRAAAAAARWMDSRRQSVRRGPSWLRSRPLARGPAASRFAAEALAAVECVLVHNNRLPPIHQRARANLIRAPRTLAAACVSGARAHGCRTNPFDCPGVVCLAAVSQSVGLR